MSTEAKRLSAEDVTCRLDYLYDEGYQCASDELRNHLAAVEAELEQVTRERDALKVCVDGLTMTIDELREQAPARPEPSRLEMAAMLAAGMHSNPAYADYTTIVESAVEDAKALIAAVKEGE